MALTKVRYGRYKAAAEADWGEQSAGQMRATVYDATTDNLWVTDIGGWVGRDTGTNASVRWALYETDSSKNPTDLVGYTDLQTVSASMVSGSGGASYTPDVSGDPLMLYSGNRYAIAALPTVASIEFSMRQASAITADNEQLYTRAGLSQPPPDPFGSYSAAVEGHQSYWAETWKNEPPEAPSNGLYPAGTISETAPVFTADFDDLNGSYGTSSGDGVDTGDTLNAYRLQLRLASGGSLLWDTPYNSTNAEEAADAASRAYGGSALTRGVAYEWRIKMSDRFGEYSDYSAWTTFTPAALGFVTLDSNPTGKIEDNTPDFSGRWNHQTAVSMKTVQVRLRTPSGTILQTGADYNIADVASSALPGTLFTIAWANTGFTMLNWGTSYKYQIRGYDGTNWSDWSATRTFNTNAAPSVPSVLAPGAGLVTSSPPLLSFRMTDADDTVATGLKGWLVIDDPGVSTFLREATYNATTDRWEYQTVAGPGDELNAFGFYSWTAQGYDGTLWSGEGTSGYGDGTVSTQSDFTFADGPVVTVTSPADGATVATASLTVSWTATDQVKYQIRLYEDNGSTLVYDSGLVTSALQSRDIPSGYLRNNTSYDLVVSVTNSAPLVGSSSIVNIAVSFTPADTVENFQVNPVSIGLDPFDTAIRLTWDQTAYSAPEFQEYIIYRSAGGGPDATRIILARITSPSIVQFIDYTPASGYEYTYEITVSIVTGVDSLESDPVEGTATVTLLGTVLTLVGNGGTYRSCLLNVRERDFDRQMQEAVYQSPNFSKPVRVRSLARYWNGSYEGAMVANTAASALLRWNELDELDAQQGICCIRDNVQRKRFGKIIDLSQTDEKPGWFSYQFGFGEELFSEGEA